MVYRKYRPTKVLENFIECYYVWESSDDHYGNLEVESPPSAFTSIVFNYRDPYSVSDHKGQEIQVPQQFIVGQQTYSYKLHFWGKIGMAGIVFKPTGIASLMNISMYALTRERVDLKLFIEDEKLTEVINHLVCSQSPYDKYKVLEAFILGYYQQNKPEYDLIDQAANLIIEKKGKVDINDLSKKCFVSRRQFERKFLIKVGLSPKYYARLRRIGYICAQIAGKEKVNWQELYLQNDFYDQSHFIKDFTEFTGRAPEKYFFSNKELIHHLKGN
ncbi:MAG: AraC family transcriptional regulator [Ginsengibacter sp.]